MRHSLTIKPAIPPEQRHEIEDVLEKMGYHVIGGGSHTDMSKCDISFNDHDDKDDSASTATNMVDGEII